MNVQLSAVIESILIATSDALDSEKILAILQERVKQAKEERDECTDEEAEEKETLGDEIQQLEEVSLEKVTEFIHELNAYYHETGRSFQILDTAFGWKIYTNPEFAPVLTHLFPDAKAQKLSQPAMETLAIIAYRQPITKASIEAVRGVSSDGMVQRLLDAELVRIAGRSELPGRPLLYETTEFFYEHFGVKSIDDLPNSQELRNMAWPTTTAEDDAADQPKQMALGEFSERKIQEESAQE